MNKNVNRIYEKMIDGERVYCIEHTPTGLCAIFDYDESAKERVLEESKKRAKQLTPHSTKDGDGRQLEYGKSRHGYCATSLATVLYSHYKNIPLDELISDGGQVRHYSNLTLPDNWEDCRSASLYSTKDIVMDTESRKITLLDGGKYIRLDLKAYGVTEYLSNAPGMLELIGKPNNMSFFVNKSGRTQAKIYHPICEDGREPYISMVAYACYYMGINETNFREKLPEIRKAFRKNDRTIDHLNSDVHNNCAWNLSVMPSGANTSKHDYVGRIKPPWFLYSAVTESGEYACRKDTRYSMVYSGRAVEHIDSGKGQYQHGVNVRYPTNLKHRIKILGDIIPCSICVAANGNVCLHEEVSYTIMDEKMSIGNILNSSFSEMVDTHNFNCLLLCSETDTFMLEEAAKRDEKQFRVVNYLRFRNILCRRVLGLREKAHREFPNVPAQSIISQLQFPTDEEVREIALWIWDNDFPRDISDEVANFATTIDEHIDTPEEAMYLDSLYQLIMTWWEMNDGAITMPPHYLEQEKRQFWGIEFDNEFYDNPVCLPWNENYECNANPDGSIDYSTKLSMSANGDYERAMYQDTIDNILANVLLLEEESP